ncbi:hypothetical protein WJX75_009565 [Coccomyxa subellipsoidea]|uniref:Uncharacterized protein n=1 Tax=Coccomyxa subellipsoidea TaxID=248742 RepID=A0ABR2Z1V9_9CHLO
MAAGHQEGDTGGAEDWDFGCHDDTDNVSNLSAASKIKFHLHKRDWQKIGSRSIQDNHVTAQEDEQASVHKINPVPGSATCEDSSDEEYESRCTKIHAQPAKRPRQGNQSHPGHDAKSSHAPGVQTSETEVEIESGMVWPADSSPCLQKYLLARDKEQVASRIVVTGTGHAPPFHPPPHELDVEE